MSGSPWCACKRLRADVFSDGVHDRCGRPTQGGPAGATPINVAAALRDDSSTGVGTPGDGIGEPGDPASTLSVSGATPAVFYGRVDRSQEERVNDDKSAQAGHLLVDPPPIGSCGCCPADPKPDSARYRACGNAVTVNVAEWIGERLLDKV